MLSRVADTVYWMSRYLERAEHTARLVDVNLNLMLDQAPDSGANPQKLLLDSLSVVWEEDAPPLDDAYAVASRLTFDQKNPNSIVSCLSLARENGRQVREQISSEMYEQLNRIYLKMRAPDVEEEWNAQPHEFFSDVKEGAHLFHGVTDQTMSHGEAWQFIRVGRSLERASETCRLLRAHCASLTDEDGSGASASDYLEWVGLLRSCTSFEAYCKAYTADVQPGRIVEFLLLDDAMPRSVRFCADTVEEALDAIASTTPRRKNSRLARVAGKLRSMLDYAQIDEIMANGLQECLITINNGCGDIHNALFSTYIGYATDAA